MNNNNTTTMTLQERLKKYKDETFTFYFTPRHEYLLVPNELVKDLGLQKTITCFSYEKIINRKKWLYLEGHHDAAQFDEAYKVYYGKYPNTKTEDIENKTWYKMYNGLDPMLSAMFGNEWAKNNLERLKKLSNTHLVEQN